MKPERQMFLSLRHPPARLNAEEASWFLGFLPHEIPVLIAARLLKPLGNPAPNSPKFFLTSTLEDLKQDQQWFSNASDAIMDYWYNKNRRKSSYLPGGRSQRKDSPRENKGTLAVEN